jgi:hypothetical protein
MSALARARRRTGPLSVAGDIWLNTTTITISRWLPTPASNTQSIAVLTMGATTTNHRMMIADKLRQPAVVP